MPEMGERHPSWKRTIGRPAILGALSAIVIGEVTARLTTRTTQLHIIHILNYVIPALLVAGAIGGLLLFKPWRRK